MIGDDVGFTILSADDCSSVGASVGNSDVFIDLDPFDLLFFDLDFFDLFFFDLDFFDLDFFDLDFFDLDFFDLDFFDFLDFSDLLLPHFSDESV